MIRDNHVYMTRYHLRVSSSKETSIGRIEDFALKLFSVSSVAQCFNSHVEWEQLKYLTEKVTETAM